VTIDLLNDIEQSDTSYLIYKLESSKSEIIQTTPTGTIAKIEIELLQIQSKMISK